VRSGTAARGVSPRNTGSALAVAGRCPILHIERRVPLVQGRLLALRPDRLADPLPQLLRLALDLVGASGGLVVDQQ